jgi:hypothetical protein
MADSFRRGTRHFGGLSPSMPGMVQSINKRSISEDDFDEISRTLRNQAQPAPMMHLGAPQPPAQQPMLPLTGQERTPTSSSANFMRSVAANNAATNVGLAQRKAANGNPIAGNVNLNKAEIQAMPYTGNPNHFLSRGLATDANTRENTMLPYQAGIAGSVANVNNAGAAQGFANAQHMIPAQAQGIRADSGMVRAQTDQVEAFTPFVPAQATTQIQGQQVQNHNNYMQGMNNFQQGQIQNELGGQMIQPTVEGAYVQNESTMRGMGGAEEQIKQLRAENQQFRTLLQRYQSGDKGGGALGIPNAPPGGQVGGAAPIGNSPAGNGGGPVRVNSAKEASQLPSHIETFQTPDGRIMLNPNFARQ